MTQFTANEVRELAKHMESVGWRLDSNGDRDCYDEGAARSAEMLFAFADLLEAQEKAVPVLWVDKHELKNAEAVEREVGTVPVSTIKLSEYHVPLYSHPAPPDADRLAEALRELVVACEEHDAMVSRIIGHPAGWNAQYLNSARQALAAHSAPAQLPAASVPEALRLLQSVLCDTDGNCCIRGTYEDRRTVDKALAMLTAQEQPNG